MDSKLMKIVKTLFTWSRLEEGRTTTAHADPRDISAFGSVQDLVFHSLKAPNLVHTQTPSGNPLPTPKASSRPFQDENLLRKLVQHRDKIPTSSRVIRSKPPAPIKGTS